MLERSPLLRFRKISTKFEKATIYTWPNTVPNYDTTANGIMPLETKTDRRSSPLVRWPKDTVTADRGSVSRRSSGAMRKLRSQVVNGYMLAGLQPSLGSKKPKGAPNKPEVVLPLRNKNVRAGQQTTLTCRIPSEPRGSVSWYKNGESLNGEERVELLASKHGAYKLVIHDTQGDDGGVYEAVVENDAGRAQTGCEMTVLDDGLQNAPYFMQFIDDQIAAVGSEVVLKCKVSGTTGADIVWMKDGQNLKTTRHLKLGFLQSGLCMLTIHSCIVGDSGKYSCLASNVVGKDSSEAMLMVVQSAAEAVLGAVAKSTEKKREMGGKRGPIASLEKRTAPKFVKTPRDKVDLVLGQSICLICQAVANPSPEYMWKKDGVQVKIRNSLG